MKAFLLRIMNDNVEVQMDYNAATDKLTFNIYQKNNGFANFTFYHI